MRILWLAAIGSLVVGCGGGGGGNSSPAAAAQLSPPAQPSPTPVAQPPPAPPGSNANFGGIWIGTLTYADQTFDDVLALTTDDGRFALIAVETAGPGVSQYAGTATVVGDRVTGTGKGYAAPGPHWPGSGTVLPISLDATLGERLALDGNVILGTGPNARLALDYVRDAHERDSSLALLTGVWYVYDEMQNPMATYSFEPDGRFLGQNANGCQSSGRVSIIDASYNVYAWEAEIAHCANGGTFAGLGMLADVSAGGPPVPPNAFLVTVTNGTQAIVLPLER